MLNIDDLTIGQLKQVQSLSFGQLPQRQEHPFVGRHVIARCYSAGVHAGVVASVDGENVVLKDSRRLWSWKAKDGIALSGVAQNGIKSDSKVDTVNPEIYLTGVCELIPTSKAAQVSIDEHK